MTIVSAQLRVCGLAAPTFAMAVLCGMLAGGCVPSVSRDYVQSLAASIQDGRTTKAELQARLGPPSREYIRGKVWTYSGAWWLLLADDAVRQQFATVILENTDAVRYHLVVVFADGDVVRIHRVVNLR